VTGASPSPGAPLLHVENLKTHFFTLDGTVKAVDGVTFDVGHGETLGIVGESGCGKSITSLSVMRLIERPGRIVDGKLLLNGDDLLMRSDEEMRNIRGDQVSMIFQEPMTSLNPVFTCGSQIAEAVQQHTAVSQREAWDRAVEMLSLVGIPDPKQRAREYPHQLSGGMRQRVMIAMALSTNPDLLIADEPTTALDVTIQAQILELMRDLREKNRMAIMLITHDLGVVAEMADHVVVMYSGKVVERGEVRAIYGESHHPYTKGLLHSIPRLDERVERLEVIKGTVPSPLNLPTGCLFKRRCPYRMPICDVAPPYREVQPGHMSRCWLTPSGEQPEIGADAPADEAEAEAERLTVEGR
jgi:oligopeptide/dipeptide ABC transporter ATP-binding protein